MKQLFVYIGIIILPFLPITMGISPPQPMLTSILTSLFSLLALKLTRHLPLSFFQNYEHKLLAWSLVIMTSSVLGYFILFYLFAFRIPTTSEITIVGCGFTDNARLISPEYQVSPLDDCPGNFENLLKDATYNAYEIWSKYSILTVRTLIYLTWNLFFLSLTIILSLIFRYPLSAKVNKSTLISASPKTLEPYIVSTDVFLGYSRNDYDRALLVSDALKSEGLSVWWDIQIHPGETWDEVIPAALASAGIVVILWSKNSINSTWVREEAHRAKRSQKLLPAIIDDVEIPYGFELVQAANLKNWNGDKEHVGFRKLLDGINHFLISQTTS